MTGQHPPPPNTFPSLCRPPQASEHPHAQVTGHNRQASSRMAAVHKTHPAPGYFSPAHLLPAWRGTTGHSGWASVSSGWVSPHRHLLHASRIRPWSHRTAHHGNNRIILRANVNLLHLAASPYQPDPTLCSYSRRFAVLPTSTAQTTCTNWPTPGVPSAST